MVLLYLQVLQFAKKALKNTEISDKYSEIWQIKIWTPFSEKLELFLKCNKIWSLWFVNLLELLFIWPKYKRFSVFHWPAEFHYVKRNTCVVWSICDGTGSHQCSQHEWLAYVWRYNNTEVYIGFQGDICCHQGNVISQKVSGCFRRTGRDVKNVNP